MNAATHAGTLKFRRAAFWVYAAIVFTGTHWPRLRLPGAGRPDLLIHLSTFGAWTAILISAGFFGAVLSRRNIGTAAVIAPIYAAIDELLQAIPFVHRTAAFDDWLANCLGILLVVGGAMVIRTVRARATPAAKDLPVSSPPP